MEKKAFSAFESPMQTGFQIAFANGYSVSVIFGRGSYSDGGKTTAEMAAWETTTGKWYVPKEWKNSDNVKGHCSPDEVAKFINEVSSL